MRIDVTAEHIAGGKQRDCALCPIALAALVHDPNFVHVGDDFILLGFEERHAYLPDEAMRFIQSFDKGWHVEPFSFEVDL